MRRGWLIANGASSFTSRRTTRSGIGDRNGLNSAFHSPQSSEPSWNLASIRPCKRQIDAQPLLDELETPEARRAAQRGKAGRMRNDGRLCNAHFAHWQVLYPPVASFCAALDENSGQPNAGSACSRDIGDPSPFRELYLRKFRSQKMHRRAATLRWTIFISFQAGNLEPVGRSAVDTALLGLFRQAIAATGRFVQKERTEVLDHGHRACVEIFPTDSIAFRGRRGVSDRRGYGAHQGAGESRWFPGGSRRTPGPGIDCGKAGLRGVEPEPRQIRAHGLWPLAFTGTASSGPQRFAGAAGRCHPVGHERHRHRRGRCGGCRGRFPGLQSEPPDQFGHRGAIGGIFHE
jgi:hypothetical protein